MPTGRVGLVREFGLLALAGTSPGLASQADGNVHSRSHPWEEALAHLDCRSSEDSHFDPVWEKLKTASVRHRWMGQTFLVPALVGNSNETVSPGKHGVQQSSLPAGLDVEREPVMSAEGLFELCEELLERWYPIVWDSPELFDQVLKRRQPPSDLGGLCYYGLITAIFIYAQFMCERHRDFSTALKMVQASLQMLGARLHLDFIHEASSWPFDSLVLMENRDRLLGWLNPADASPDAPAEVFAEEEPRVFVLSASSIPQLSPRVPVARTRASWRWTPISRSLWRRRTRSSLTVAVFGVHSTLVLEPATMLKVALLPFVRVQVRVFMRDCPKGYAAWAHHCLLQCQALGDCGASGGSGQLFVDLVHMFEDASAYPDNYYRVADYLELLTQMYRMDPDLQAAPLYVCTSPLMCSLLRAAFEKPLLAYFGMQLHVNLDRQKDQLWLMHFKEMARDRCTNVMAVHNFAMQEQIRYATASQLEVVRPRALYAHAGVRLWRLRSVHDRPKSWDRARAAPLAQRRPQVLIFRSSYLHYSLFVPLLEAALTGNLVLAIHSTPGYRRSTVSTGATYGSEGCVASMPAKLQDMMIYTCMLNGLQSAACQVTMNFGGIVAGAPPEEVGVLGGGAPREGVGGIEGGAPDLRLAVFQAGGLGPPQDGGVDRRREHREDLHRTPLPIRKDRAIVTIAPALADDLSVEGETTMIATIIAVAILAITIVKDVSQIMAIELLPVIVGHLIEAELQPQIDDGALLAIIVAGMIALVLERVSKRQIGEIDLHPDKSKREQIDILATALMMSFDFGESDCMAVADIISRCRHRRLSDLAWITDDELNNPVMTSDDSLYLRSIVRGIVAKIKQERVRSNFEKDQSSSSIIDREAIIGLKESIKAMATSREKKDRKKSDGINRRDESDDETPTFDLAASLKGFKISYIPIDWFGDIRKLSKFHKFLEKEDQRALIKKWGLKVEIQPPARILSMISSFWLSHASEEFDIDALISVPCVEIVTEIQLLGIKHVEEKPTKAPPPPPPPVGAKGVAASAAKAKAKAKAVAEPGRKQICFNHDPSRSGVCSLGSKCSRDHLDTAVAESLARFQSIALWRLRHPHLPPSFFIPSQRQVARGRWLVRRIRRALLVFLYIYIVVKISRSEDIAAPTTPGKSIVRCVDRISALGIEGVATSLETIDGKLQLTFVPDASKEDLRAILSSAVLLLDLARQIIGRLSFAAWSVWGPVASSRLRSLYTFVDMGAGRINQASKVSLAWWVDRLSHLEPRCSIMSNPVDEVVLIYTSATAQSNIRLINLLFRSNFRPISTIAPLRKPRRRIDKMGASSSMSEPDVIGFHLAQIGILGGIIPVVARGGYQVGSCWVSMLRCVAEKSEHQSTPYRRLTSLGDQTLAFAGKDLLCGIGCFDSIAPTILVLGRLDVSPLIMSRFTGVERIHGEEHRYVARLEALSEPPESYFAGSMNMYLEVANGDLEPRSGFGLNSLFDTPTRVIQQLRRLFQSVFAPDRAFAVRRSIGWVDFLWLIVLSGPMFSGVSPRGDSCIGGEVDRCPWNTSITIGESWMACWWLSVGPSMVGQLLDTDVMSCLDGGSAQVVRRLAGSIDKVVTSSAGSLRNARITAVLGGGRPAPVRNPIPLLIEDGSSPPADLSLSLLKLFIAHAREVEKVSPDGSASQRLQSVGFPMSTPEIRNRMAMFTSADHQRWGSPDIIAALNGGTFSAIGRPVSFVIRSELIMPAAVGPRSPPAGPPPFAPLGARGSGSARQ
ncbi:unnamed protein product [Polarella glacialis]|uniref:C3H1-type domain-containing protein n=1 Tax=Polarella glacialis TaxID=89957 RepID=A0A813J602_POLGL|nr:unnamed protein product [Polarella glacialis]